MRPLHVWARNLRTWETLDLELPEGVCAVVGPNGAGKSSLVTIVDLALFAGRGELRRHLTRGAGADTVEVGVTFDHGGEVYRVRRSVVKGKPRLDFEQASVAVDYPNEVVAWAPLTRETIEATEAELGRVLGLTRQTFRASSYLAQGDGAAFTEAQPRDRKAILLDALGVRVWDELKEKATKLRADTEAELMKTLGHVESLAGQLEGRDGIEAMRRSAEQDAEQLRMTVADIERGLEAAREELEEATAQAAERTRRQERALEARRRVDEAKLRHERATQVIADAEREAAGLADLEEQAALEPKLAEVIDLQRARDEKDRAAAELDTLAEQLHEQGVLAAENVDRLVEQVAALTAEIEGLEAKGGTCPTCEQPLGPEPLGKAIGNARVRLAYLEADRDGQLAHAQDIAKRADEVARSIEQRGREATEANRLFDEARRALPDHARRDLTVSRMAAAGAREKASTLKGKTMTLALYREEIARLEVDLPELEEVARNTAAAAEELGGVDVGAIRRRCSAADAQLVDKRARLRATEEQVARHVGMLDRLDDVKDTLDRGRAIVERLQDDVALYRLAEKAYGRDGIPALILEAQAIPHLEAEANRLIVELGRPYRFELRTTRATREGEQREALDIIVMTETGEADYHDFSGGERTRLDLALRIALARLVAARRGADVRLLTIDEPTYLDARGFAQLARVLRDLAGEFETVLVVSHDEELRDAFDAAIVVAGGADTGEPSRLEEGDHDAGPGEARHGAADAGIVSA